MPRSLVTSTPAAPAVNDGRVEEHRNLGVAFYKAQMLDEGLREFRRVAELRPADASAPFFLGLIAARQGRWARPQPASPEWAARRQAQPAPRLRSSPSCRYLTRSGRRRAG